MKRWGGIVPKACTCLCVWKSKQAGQKSGKGAEPFLVVQYLACAHSNVRGMEAYAYFVCKGFETDAMPSLG